MSQRTGMLTTSQVRPHIRRQVSLTAAKASGISSSSTSRVDPLPLGRIGLVFEGLGDPLAELDGLGPQRLVAERLVGGKVLVDLVDDRLDALEITIVLGAEDGFEQGFEHRFSG